LKFNDTVETGKEMTSVYEDIIYWERRMDSLELSINRYAHVRAWTSEIIKKIEYMEFCIEECEYELNMLYSEIDKQEWIYD